MPDSAVCLWCLLRTSREKVLRRWPELEALGDHELFFWLQGEPRCVPEKIVELRRWIEKRRPRLAAKIF